MEVISKAERTAVRRSLHRMVRGRASQHGRGGAEKLWNDLGCRHSARSEPQVWEKRQSGKEAEPSWAKAPTNAKGIYRKRLTMHEDESRESAQVCEISGHDLQLPEQSRLTRTR